jgi:hypothetical protein
MQTVRKGLLISTAVLVLGMFGFNLWISANFSKGLMLPQCYMPLSLAVTVLILITMITTNIRK